MPEKMEEKITALLEESGLSEMQEEILSTLVPCVVIKPGEEDEDLPVGSSKFGGLPDLPANEPYPEAPGTHLSFLAQYNLKELASIGEFPFLPESGMLYFFLAVDEIPPDSPLNPGSWLVFYRSTEAKGLVPALLPEDMPRELLLPERGITFVKEKQLPDVEATEDMEDMEDMYFHLMDQLYELENREGGYHQAFGQPLELSGDVFKECALRSGLPGEWTLLLQVDSDPETLEMAWGNLGMLYFCITEEDLAALRFERTWLVTQAH
ncbi:YwqG family protein [Salinithrix halophila]|uniref:YwqG family protein n=1 Tax=Salinithrix halophila TaxID=1485204 RepID=A0ABV8JKY2_9BACL